MVGIPNPCLGISLSCFRRVTSVLTVLKSPILCVLVKLFYYIPFNFKITFHPFIFRKGQPFVSTVYTPCCLLPSVFLKPIFLRTPAPAPQKAALPGDMGASPYFTSMNLGLHLCAASWAWVLSPVECCLIRGAWVLLLVSP